MTTVLNSVDIQPGTASAPRLRLMNSIDLSKARRNCKCKGTGIAGWQLVDLGDGNGEQRVKIICSCVTRRGGVKKDQMDHILGQLQKQLDEGVFAEQLAGDILRLPIEARPAAIAKLRSESQDESKNKQVLDALRAAIGIIDEQIQKQGEA